MRTRIIITLQFFALAFSSIEATTGTFLHGWGAKSSAMGGIGVAYPQDSIVSSINPAGMYWVGNRMDEGLILFNPTRGYSYTGTPGLIEGDSARSRQDLFVIPVAGYSNRYCKCLSYGVSLWGNGGTNTDYSKNNPVFGKNSLGVDFAQVITTPTLSYLFRRNHSFGIAPLLGFQRICLNGLDNFANFSSRPDKVTNNEYSHAIGLGVRIGWMGKLSKRLWLGASYSTKVWMTKFHGYTGILANNAKFDIPENWTIGFRYLIACGANIAFDYQRINYKDSKPIGNRIQRIFNYPLGTSNGAGFGWRDISVYKVGVDFKWNQCLTVRCGYTGCPVPYDSSQIDPNIIAPAVVKHHLCLGFTYLYSHCYEIDFTYVHALHNSIMGESIFNLGTVKHWMHQNSWALQIGKKY